MQNVADSLGYEIDTGSMDLEDDSGFGNTVSIMNTSALFASFNPDIESFSPHTPPETVDATLQTPTEREDGLPQTPPEPEDAPPQKPPEPQDPPPLFAPPRPMSVRLPQEEVDKSDDVSEARRFQQLAIEQQQEQLLQEQQEQLLQKQREQFVHEQLLQQQLEQNLQQRAVEKQIERQDRRHERPKRQEPKGEQQQMQWRTEYVKAGPAPVLEFTPSKETTSAMQYRKTITKSYSSTMLVSASKPQNAPSGTVASSSFVALPQAVVARPQAVVALPQAAVPVLEMADMNELRYENVPVAAEMVDQRIAELTQLILEDETERVWFHRLNADISPQDILKIGATFKICNVKTAILLRTETYNHNLGAGWYLVHACNCRFRFTCNCKEVSQNFETIPESVYVGKNGRGAHPSFLMELEKENPLRLVLNFALLWEMQIYSFILDGKVFKGVGNRLRTLIGSLTYKDRASFLALQLRKKNIGYIMMVAKPRNVSRDELVPQTQGEETEKNQLFKRMKPSPEFAMSLYNSNEAHPILDEQLSRANYDKFEFAIAVTTEILWAHACIPIGDAVKLDSWSETRFGDCEPNGEILQKAIARCERRMERFPISDWWAQLRLPTSNPQFDINANYMSIAKSYRLLIQWCKWHWGEEWKGNCRKLKRILLLQNGKEGCGHIWGDAGAGKTWAIRGMVQTMIKPGSFVPDGANFPFNELQYARVLFMDEVKQIKEEHHSVLLNIFSGASDQVAIKYYGAYTTQAMGAILCSNDKDVGLPMQEAKWRDRVAYFHVRKLEGPLWENVDFTRRVHPMAWLQVWEELDAEEIIELNADMEMVPEGAQVDYE